MDDFIEALYSYSEARGRLKECVDGCEYDADYFCFQQKIEEEAIKQHMKIALIEIIQEQIKRGITNV